MRCLSAAVAKASEALVQKCSLANGGGSNGGKKVLVQSNRSRAIGKAHGPKSR